MQFQTALLAAIALGMGACASRGGAAAQEMMRIEVVFETAEVSRSCAPTLTTWPGQVGQVTTVRPVSYIADYDVEVNQCDFRADPIVETIDEGVWLDVLADRRADGSISFTYQFRRNEVVQPMKTFATTLGVFTTPVTVGLPEVRQVLADGTLVVQPGVETELPQPPNAADLARLVVRVRITPVQADRATPQGGEPER